MTRQMGAIENFTDNLPLAELTGSFQHAEAAAATLSAAGIYDNEKLEAALRHGATALQSLHTAHNELIAYSRQLQSGKSGGIATETVDAGINPETRAADVAEHRLYEGTTLARDEFLAEHDRWTRRETVQSGGTAIGEVMLSADDLRTLQKITTPYDEAHWQHLNSPGANAILGRRGLTPEQIAIIRKVAKGFVTAVAEDAERGALGEPELKFDIFISVGQFNPELEGHGNEEGNGLGWHADDYDEPAVRYVLTFGDTGSTVFARGPVEYSDIRGLGGVGRHPDTLGAAGRWQVEQHRPGIISRFPANYGLHNTPSKGGFRLFMTVSIFPKGRFR